MPSSRAQRAVAATASVAVVTLGIVGLSLVPEPREAAAAELKPYESCVPLLAHYRAELRRTATAWGFDHGGNRLFAGDGSIAVAAPAPARAGGAGARTTSAVGSGATGTNTQEAGVDEPDSAKIAGGVIYTYTGGKLRLLAAGERLRVLATVPVSNYSLEGELLVAGDRVLLIVPGERDRKTAAPAPGPAARTMVAPAQPQEPVTKVLLYDVSDPARPRRLEEYQIDGRYVSARLTGGRVRLVTTSAPTSLGAQPRNPQGKPEQDAALAENRRRADLARVEDLLPRAVRRDAAGRVVSDRPALGCTDVSRPAEPTGASTIVVSTFVPSRGLTPSDTTGVTAEGDLVYATADRLYVATSRWSSARPQDSGAPWTPDSGSTGIHAFATGELDRVRYVGSGTVPGWVLGQWAFSHHEDHLRVATTLQPPWRGTDRTAATSSSVVVLAERGDQLAEVGRVDGLGPGERIHAVRYFGDIATVVTFRQTDPLYVLDLANPRAPKVRGELKIPGFSTYLHPVGDGRLLGVGNDATNEGRVTGMQLSLFDISDLSKPRQVHRLPIGNGHSPALYDSRGFNYDPARRLAILPFQSFEGGEPVVLGVRVGADGTLTEAGRVPGSPGLDRALYDADHVYGTGQTGVVAGSARTFQRTGEVRFG